MRRAARTWARRGAAPLRGAALICCAILTAINAGRAAEQLQLDVTVNGSNVGLIVPVSRAADGGMTISVADARAIGLETRDAGRVVNLSTLPGVSAEYDAARQKLNIEASALALQPQRLSRPRAPPVPAESGIGFAINYDLSYRTLWRYGRSPQSSGALTFDSWVFAPIGRLATTGFASFGPDQQTLWRRYETRIEREFPAQALSIRIGDTITSTLPTGRSIRLGGVSLSRDFTLRPDLVTVPLPSFEGSVSVPTSVDVFVSGNRVLSSRNVTGRFRVEDLPVPQGAGTAILALQGPDGRIERQELSFFGTRQLLKRGTADWSVEVGRPRLGFGTADARYSDLTVANGTLRYGVTDGVTLSLHAATAEGFREATLGFATTLAGRAEVSGLVGDGGDSSTSGRFFQVGGSAHLGQGWQVEAQYYHAEDGFTDLAAAIDRQNGEDDAALRRRTIISLGRQALGGSQSFGVSYIHTEGPERESKNLTAGLARQIGRGTLSLSGRHDLLAGDSEVSAVYSIRFGDTTVLGTADSESGVSVLAARPIRESGPRWGYTLEASGLGDASERIAARLSLETGVGRAETFVSTESDRQSADVRLRGAIASVSGKIALGPTVRSGFAIVETGRANIPIRLQNRRVATTGLGGRALVSELNDHRRNRVSILVDDVPNDAVWTTTAEDVTPARRSGVLVDLTLQDPQSQRLVNLVAADGADLPAGARVTVDSVPHPLGLGYDGALLLTDPREGAVIRVSSKNGTCEARLPAMSTTNPEAICR